MKFAVLHHTAWPGRADHYDLLLQLSAGRDEDDRVLLTFATLCDEFPNAGCELQRLPDHRRAFLTLEGELSGARGRVERVDSGTFRWFDPLDISGRDCRVEFHGSHLRGSWRLLLKSGGNYSLDRIP